MKCRFPECAAQLSLAAAWVPELSVLRRLAGEVTVSTLVENAHCARHAREGRRQGLRFFSYQSSVLELNRRQAERAVARRHFSSYGPAKQAKVKKTSQPSPPDPTAKPR